MFGFGKKVEIKKKNINEVYDICEKDPSHHIIICADEQKEFDALRIAGAECLPLRLMNKIEEFYPDKEITYYVYAINFAVSEKACKIMAKKGYNAYDLGSFLEYDGFEEGMNARRKKRKR